MVVALPCTSNSKPILRGFPQSFLWSFWFYSFCFSMIAAIGILFLAQGKIKLVHLAKKSQDSPDESCMFYYNWTSRHHAYYFLICYNCIFSSKPKEIFSCNPMKDEERKLAQNLILLWVAKSNLLLYHCFIT